MKKKNAADMNSATETRSAGNRAQQLADGDDDSMTYANNGSSVYIPANGKVRFYIIPAEGEELLSATLDGEDIMPYIEDGVYETTADKKNAKLVVVFSGESSSVVLSGDVNADASITAGDASLVLQRVAGKNEEFGTNQLKAADINGDGSITAGDASLILQKVAGK